MSDDTQQAMRADELELGDAEFLRSWGAQLMNRERGARYLAIADRLEQLEAQVAQQQAHLDRVHKLANETADVLRESVEVSQEQEALLQQADSLINRQHGVLKLAMDNLEYVLRVHLQLASGQAISAEDQAFMAELIEGFGRHVGWATI